MMGIHAYHTGAAHFLLWMVLVIAIGVYIGMREDKDGRRR